MFYNLLVIYFWASEIRSERSKCITRSVGYPLGETVITRALSHDVTMAMLVCQTSPVGVEHFFYAKAFFCCNKSA